MKLRWVERKIPHWPSATDAEKASTFPPGKGYIERVLQCWDPERFNGHWQEYGGWVDVPVEVEE